MHPEKAAPKVALKVVVVIALAVVVGLAIYAKNSSGGKPDAGVEGGATTAAVQPPSQPAPVKAVSAAPADASPAVKTPLPKLVDLGAGKCIPCKMMAPILEELKTEYQGRMDVVFIDVWENRGAGKEYGIRVIPTQIFIGSNGKELFRHEGFFAKEDILAKWAELGIELASPSEMPGKVESR